MIVVHALWRDDRLALWAEDSALTATSARAGKATTVHPFAVAADVLADILDGTAAKAAHHTAQLRLPSRGGVPLDSPNSSATACPSTAGRRWACGCGRCRCSSSTPTTRSPSSVNSNRTRSRRKESAAAAPDGGPEQAVGSTVRHLSQVAAFAHELVLRGRILPSLDRRRHNMRGRVWRPVLTGVDATWARALALALPPAGRCEAGPGHDRRRRGGGRPAIDALVDAAARIVPRGTRSLRVGG